MIHRALLLLAPAALLVSVGCDGRTHPAAPAAPFVSPAATAAEPPLLVPPVEESEVGAFAGEIARELARELGLEAGAEARVRQTIVRAWAEVLSEVEGRIEGGGDALDPEAITELLERHQRALDAEIAAGLGPAARERFAALASTEDPQ
ncbi:MAG: hypothetical protein KDD82_06405 [Planctomycetes bacterium]|nr:hypothetical protein [Planctomycetota bacterium]